MQFLNSLDFIDHMDSMISSKEKIDMIHTLKVNKSHRLK